MKDIFEGIAYLFEEILFYPLDALRNLELDSWWGWWGANAINFIFILIGIAAFVFWMKQLKHFRDTHEDERKQAPDSFLG